jgi:hypothetical protein
MHRHFAFHSVVNLLIGWVAADLGHPWVRVMVISGYPLGGLKEIMAIPELILAYSTASWVGGGGLNNQIPQPIGTHFTACSHQSHHHSS